MPAYAEAKPRDDSVARLRQLSVRVTRTHVGILVIATSLLCGIRILEGDASSTPHSGLAPLAPGVVASLGRRPTHDRLYHAEVIADSPLSVGVAQTWTVHLSRRGDRRLANARLAVTTRAPDLGLESPTSPAVRYVGGGNYRLDGITFSAPGWWNVALVIRARGGVDSVAFNVILPADRFER